MKKYIEEMLQLFGIMAIVQILWQLLEQLVLGKTNSNSVDAIIGLILILSLNANLNTWKRKE